MTIIFIIFCSAIFIGYSYADLKRKNPISSISEVQYVERTLVNFHEQKIWIPFRIVTDENKFIDHRGIMKIVPSLVKGEYKEGFGMKLKYTLLNYKLCNETSMANSTNYFRIDIPLNELFCLEEDNITFGGDWNLHFTNYLEIGLYLCDENFFFDKSSQECQNLINLLQTINSSLSFDFYYPVVQFSPTNFTSPLSIVYKNYFYRLSRYSYKIEKLYIQEHILSDDINFLKSEMKNQSRWGFISIFGDAYSLSSEIDPLINNFSNKIYTLEIYMDSGIKYYTRTYKKLFEIISDIFPIFNLVLYFIKKFTQHIKTSITKRKLSSLIFEKKDDKPKKLFDKKFKDLTNSNIKSNLSNNTIHKNDKMGNINNNNDNNILSVNENKLPLSNNNQTNSPLISKKLNEENALHILNKKDITIIKKNGQNEPVGKPLKIIAPFQRKKLAIKKKKEIYIFPLLYFFMDCIFNKLIFPRKFFCISKTYFTVYNFMCQIYDISTHIILFKQFNFINNIFLEKIHEENGTCPAKPYNKINLNDNSIIEQINKDLNDNKSILYTKNLM